MTIELSLDAGSNDSFLSGTYFQGTGLINEKPFWLQQSGSHAIWSYEVTYGSVWMIGDVNHLGNFHGIYQDESYHQLSNLSMSTILHGYHFAATKMVFH